MLAEGFDLTISSFVLVVAEEVLVRPLSIGLLLVLLEKSQAGGFADALDM